MQIRQIEEDLGVSLLIRHSRGVAPTKAGSLLYARAIAIIKMVEETRSEVAACDREEGETIRLGITPALMLAAGTEITLTIGEQLPRAFLIIVEGMSHILIDSLACGELDSILCYDVPESPQFQRTALPYFAVMDEVRAGTLDARPITMPSIRRTLFLAAPTRSGPFRSDADLTSAVRQSLQGMLDAMGGLAQPLWVRTD